MIDSFHSLTKTVSQIQVFLKLVEGNVLIDEPLFFHIVKYPQLRWPDIYKFILQGTCGWGHLSKIGDEEHLLNYLQKELSDAEEPFKGEELFELLEKETKLARVNLRVWKEVEGNDHKSLWELMKKKETDPVKSLRLFIKRWKQLLDRFEKDLISCLEDKKEIVKEWLFLTLEIAKNAEDSFGLPLVSHSEIYREEYKPKYRVV